MIQINIQNDSEQLVECKKDHLTSDAKNMILLWRQNSTLKLPYGHAINNIYIVIKTEMLFLGFQLLEQSRRQSIEDSNIIPKQGTNATKYENTKARSQLGKTGWWKAEGRVLRRIMSHIIKWAIETIKSC